MWNRSATFFVKGGDVGFADRERRLLECLDAAEDEKNGREDSCLNPRGDNRFAGMDVVVRKPSRKRVRAETSPFRGRESIFKRPGDPAPRFKERDMPDHRRNPHRWTRYSLGDVSPEDMSDTCNTATALAFLRELELRKGRHPTELMDCDLPEAEVVPVVFKRPGRKDDVVRCSEGPETTVFQSSKLVMPEYVVGREQKKERKVRSMSPGSKYDKSKEIKLQHLQFEDDPE